MHNRCELKIGMRVRLSALGLKRSPKTDAQAGVIISMKLNFANHPRSVGRATGAYCAPSELYRTRVVGPTRDVLRTTHVGPSQVRGGVEGRQFGESVIAKLRGRNPPGHLP